MFTSVEKYTYIDKNNLPKPGDIIATNKNGEGYYDIGFEDRFEIGFFREIVKETGIDSKTGAPVYRTLDLNNYPLDFHTIEKHKLVKSYFNDWYIVNDPKVKILARNIKIERLLEIENEKN
jgi:hypothetical protein